MGLWSLCDAMSGRLVREPHCSRLWYGTWSRDNEGTGEGACPKGDCGR